MFLWLILVMFAMFIGAALVLIPLNFVLQLLWRRYREGKISLQWFLGILAVLVAAVIGLCFFLKGFFPPEFFHSASAWGWNLGVTLVFLALYATVMLAYKYFRRPR